MNQKKKKNEYKGPYFILNHEHLKPGDIILERGYSFNSDVIRHMTNSNYSHAMIYVDGTIIEATPEGGVFSRIPNRSLVRSAEDFLVLRPSEKLSSETVYKICKDARELIGSQYSKPEAARTKLYGFIRNLFPESRKQFCSRLVAQIYFMNGIKLVESPSFCSPSDIEKSKLLKKIPSMVREASENEKAFALKEKPHDKHTKNSVDFIRQSIIILNSYSIKNVDVAGEDLVITTLNDIARSVFENRENKELDRDITNAMYESGYMDHIYSDKKSNPYRYDYSLFKFKLCYKSNPSEIEEKLWAEFEKEKSVFIHRLESYCCAKDNLYFNLMFFKAEYEICRGLIMGMLERLIVIERFTKEKEQSEINKQCNIMISEIIEIL